MRNDKTENENLPAVADDGFEDDREDGGSRLIQGVILRCVDGHWSAKDGTVITSDTRLVALSTTQALQPWQNNKPEETILKAPGTRLPDVKLLNEKIPESDWEIGLGGTKRPPWVHQHIVYLLNAADASVFTFINNTAGASIAVCNLRDRVKMMRVLRGNRVVAIVGLGSKPMPTKFGMKVRPEFVIHEWRNLGGGAAQVADAGPPAPLAIEHAGAPVEPMKLAEELNDQIPW
jgi:hypothetical protein